MIDKLKCVYDVYKQLEVLLWHEVQSQNPWAQESTKSIMSDCRLKFGKISGWDYDQIDVCLKANTFQDGYVNARSL